MSVYTTLARPYAKAAFKYALEHNALSQWSLFLQRAALIVSDKRVWNLIKGPQLSSEEKQGLILDLCEGAEQVSEQQKNFIRMLAHFHRLEMIPQVAFLFTALCKERDQTMEVEVTSAFPLDKAQQERLQKALSIRLQRDVKLNIQIDKNILGGAIIRAEDMVIDGSCSGQLQKLRQALVN